LYYPPALPPHQAAFSTLAQAIPLIKNDLAQLLEKILKPERLLSSRRGCSADWQSAVSQAASLRVVSCFDA